MYARIWGGIEKYSIIAATIYVSIYQYMYISKGMCISFPLKRGHL